MTVISTPRSAGVSRPSRSVTLSPTLQSDSGDSSGRWGWFWLVITLGTAPLTIAYLIEQWALPEKRFFPFAIESSIWLLWARWDGRFHGPQSRTAIAFVGFALLLAGLGFLFVATAVVATAAVLICLVMMHSLREDSQDSAETLGIVGLPLVSILPWEMCLGWLPHALQGLSVYYASLLLDVLSVPHAVFHHVIELSDRQLFVVEACSGVQSVYALGFLSLLLVAIKRRSSIAVPFYLAAALVLALVCNVMRITAVGVAADWYKVDLAKGVAHEAIGYLAISVAGLLLLSFDNLFATLLKPVPDTESESPISIYWNQFSGRLLGAPFQRSPTLPDGTSKNGAVVRGAPGSDCSSSRLDVSGKAWRSKLWVVGMLAFASLLLVGSFIQVAQSNRPPRRLSDDRQVIFAPPGPLARSAFEHLQVMDYQSNRHFTAPRLGPNSDVWHCLLDGLRVEVVLSQPHRGWHELSDCYERKHWRLLDRRLITPARSGLPSEVGGDGEAANYVSAIYRRGAGHYGRLIFAAIGSNGVPVDAPGNLVAFCDRAWKRLDRRGVWRQQETLMLQMWIVSDQRLTDTQLQRLTADFESFRAAISEQLITQLRPAAQAATGFQRSVDATETDASDQERRFLSAGALRGDQQ